MGLSEQDDGQRRIQGKAVDSEPEWFAGLALLKAGWDFEYQSGYFGGQFTSGGIVVDFRVFTKPKAKLWFIDGEYWHGSSTGRAQDAFERAKLQAASGLEILATPASELTTQEDAESVVLKLFGRN